MSMLEAITFDKFRVILTKLSSMNYHLAVDAFRGKETAEIRSTA
jgi:hypothetical protein